MQLPGMSTDPVRLELELTWWPPTDDFQIARKLWVRPAHSDCWQLEDMATTGSPVRLVTLPNRWADATRTAMTYFTQLVESQMDPFPGS